MIIPITIITIIINIVITIIIGHFRLDVDPLWHLTRPEVAHHWWAMSVNTFVPRNSERLVGEPICRWLWSAWAVFRLLVDDDSFFFLNSDSGLYYIYIILSILYIHYILYKYILCITIIYTAQYIEDVHPLGIPVFLSFQVTAEAATSMPWGTV